MSLESKYRLLVAEEKVTLKTLPHSRAYVIAFQCHEIFNGVLLLLSS